MRIVTWNINSVRLRINLIEEFIKNEAPDILCLQETKCPDDCFPLKEFHKLGYEYISINGIKGYNGVATISKIPIQDTITLDICNKKDGRYLENTFLHNKKRFTIYNLYVPAGGDEPNPEVNEKFAHKLEFLNEITTHFKRTMLEDIPGRILLGDLNIAPLEHDVWSHKQLRNVVSHTEIEIEKLNEMQNSYQWEDIARRFVPENEKLYSWWSYRSRDWEKSNRGRRLDHIWVTPALSKSVIEYRILSKARGWERPSDHVPVIMDLNI